MRGARPRHSRPLIWSSSIARARRASRCRRRSSGRCSKSARSPSSGCTLMPIRQTHSHPSGPANAGDRIEARTLPGTQSTARQVSGVRLELVRSVVPHVVDQRLSKAQRQTGVVGPLPCQQLERPAALQVVHRLKGSRLAELHGGAQCVAYGNRRAVVPILIHSTVSRSAHTILT